MRPMRPRDLFRSRQYRPIPEASAWEILSNRKQVVGSGLHQAAKNCLQNAAVLVVGNLNIAVNASDHLECCDGPVCFGGGDIDQLARREIVGDAMDRERLRAIKAKGAQCIAGLEL